MAVIAFLTNNVPLSYHIVNPQISRHNKKPPPKGRLLQGVPVLLALAIQPCIQNGPCCRFLQHCGARTARDFPKGSGWLAVQRLAYLLGLLGKVHLVILIAIN